MIIPVCVGNLAQLLEVVNKIKMTNDLNIMFLLPVASQPRYFKRIESLAELGIGNRIYSFEREYFKGKQDTMEYKSLGKISHGKYFSRIMPIIKALLKIQKELHSTSCLYAFGLDCAFIGVLGNVFLRTKNKQLIIYECADIRSIFLGAGFKNILFRFLERWVIKRCYLIVTTSPAFIEEYFINIQKQRPSKFYLLENKIKEPVPEPLKHKNWQGERPLIIGYFGTLRCQRTLHILVELVRRHPTKFKAYIRGYNFGINDMEKIIENEENIEYGGTYINPDDLSEIYGKVDIVWAAYQVNNTPEGINRKWAMRNQFYEACYYRTPMIVQRNTLGAKRVQELQIGMAVDMDNTLDTINYLNKIQPENLLVWIKSIIELPQNFYVYEDEHEKLFLLIKGGLRGE